MALTISEKIDIWKHYDQHLNTIENTYLNATAIIGLAISFSMGISTGEGEIKNIVLFIPIAVTFFFYYIAYQSRVIEIIRGFLCALESSIVSETGESYILWSKVGVMKFYNAKNFYCQKICAPLFASVSVFALVGSFWSMYTNSLMPHIIILAYCITVVI